MSSSCCIVYCSGQRSIKSTGKSNLYSRLPKSLQEMPQIERPKPPGSKRRQRREASERKTDTAVWPDFLEQAFWRGTSSMSCLITSKYTMLALGWRRGVLVRATTARLCLNASPLLRCLEKWLVPFVRMRLYLQIVPLSPRLSSPCRSNSLD
jgi:hypothetical protein